MRENVAFNMYSYKPNLATVTTTEIIPATTTWFACEPAIELASSPLTVSFDESNFRRRRLSTQTIGTITAVNHSDGRKCNNRETVASGEILASFTDS